VIEEGEGDAKGKGAGDSAYLHLILVSQICFCFVPFCSCHNLFVFVLCSVIQMLMFWLKRRKKITRAVLCHP
jgi:hypothetical protein